MGQEIFYCGACKTLLRSRDLEKGQALRAGDQVYCKACAAARGFHPPSPATPRMSETERIRLGATPRTPRPTPAVGPSKTLPLALAAGAGVFVVLLFFGLRRPAPQAPPEAPRRDPVAVEVAPAPEPPPPPRVVEPRPKPPDRAAQARRLLDDAQALQASDLDAALAKSRAALLEAQGTPLEAEAQRLDESIRGALKERLARKWAEIDARLKAALEAEDFGGALRVLDGEKPPDAAARAADIRRATERLWAEAKDKLAAARKKGAAGDVDALRARVERWGLPAIRDELQALLAAPVEVELSPWQKRLAELAFPLDYAAAVKDLEKAPGAEAGDLDVLRLAAEVQRELAQFKPRPGAELLGGRVLRSTAHTVEILIGDERTSIPLLELPLDLLKAGPAALAAYRALEGEGVESLPPNLRRAAERHAREKTAPAELEARKVFAEAERDFARPLSRLASAAKYAALPKDTLFGRRAKGLIEERFAASAEIFLGVDDLLPEGACAASEALKGTSTLSFLGGGEGAVRVDAEAARAWVYAGACCQEIFVLLARTPDPLPLKTSHPRARHAHAGRELRWSWVPVPLPPGTRSFKVCSDREGVSIAYVWLSNGRPGPPKESELAAFEKSLEIELPPSPRGSLLREVWTDLPGDRLTGFSGRPSSAGAIASFEGPANAGDHYLTRVRGYLHPPSSGDYVFHLASDDSSELWISADETPSKKRLVLALNGATNPRGWEDTMAPKPASVSLKAGKRYYVELLHKEGAGDDHFAVGWRLPDGSVERPIPGSRLSPYVGGGRPTGPVFFRGIDFNGAPARIDGQSWEGKEAAHVVHNGTAFEEQGVALTPPLDGPKAQMIRSSIYHSAGLNVTVSGVPPGRYHVYVYVWEDNSSVSFEIAVNQKVVVPRHESGARGRWDRLGPFLAEPAEGRIDLRFGAGDANLSGLEIWRLR